MVGEVSVCSGVVRMLGKPAGHAVLGGSQRPGFPGQMPGIGRPGMVDSVQPFSEILQGVLQCVHLNLVSGGKGSAVSDGGSIANLGDGLGSIANLGDGLSVRHFPMNRSSSS